MLLDTFEQRTFDFEVFDNSFDDEIAVFDLREVVVEVSWRDE